MPGTKLFCPMIVAKLFDKTMFEMIEVGTFTDVDEDEEMTVSEVLVMSVMRSPNCVKGGLIPAGSVEIWIRTPMKPGKSGVTHWTMQSVWSFSAEMPDGGAIAADRLLCANNSTKRTVGVTAVGPMFAHKSWLSGVTASTVPESAAVEKFGCASGALNDNGDALETTKIWPFKN